MSDVTRLIDAAAAGDPKAAAELLPLVYEELRKLAAKRAEVRRRLAQEAKAKAAGAGVDNEAGTSAEAVANGELQIAAADNDGAADNDAAGDTDEGQPQRGGLPVDSRVQIRQGL